MKKDKVVLDQHKDALIEDLEGLGSRELEKLRMAQVDDIEQGHVDHQLHLDPGLLKEGECDKDEERSTHQEDWRIRNHS